MKSNQTWLHCGLTVALVGLTVSGCAGTGKSIVQKPSMPRFKNPVSSLKRSADAPLSNAQISNVQLAMARTLERQGELEKARQAYQQILGKDPKQGDAVHRLAIVCDRLGHADEAEKHFKRALKLKPANADVFCDLGYSYYLQKRWAEAEMNLKQALALNSDMNRAHNNLGLLYAHSDRFKNSFEQFMLAGCTPAEAHANIAFVMTMRDEWGAAHDEYERALTLDPSLELAQKRLQLIENSLAVAPVSGNAKEVELTSHSKSK